MMINSKAYGLCINYVAVLTYHMYIATLQTQLTSLFSKALTYVRSYTYNYV